MSITAGKIDEMLTDFVVENDALLEEASQDDRDVYDVIMNTITLLSNKFGQGAISTLERKEPAPTIEVKKPKTRAAKNKVDENRLMVYEFVDSSIYAVILETYRNGDILFAGIVPNKEPNVTEYSVDGGSFYLGQKSKSEFERMLANKEVKKVGYLRGLMKGNIYTYIDGGRQYYLLISDVDLTKTKDQIETKLFYREFDGVNLGVPVGVNLGVPVFVETEYFNWDGENTRLVKSINYGIFNPDLASPDYYIGCIFPIKFMGNPVTVCIYKSINKDSFVKINFFDIAAQKWGLDTIKDLGFINLLDSKADPTLNTWIDDFIAGKKVIRDEVGVTPPSLSIMEMKRNPLGVWKPTPSVSTQNVITTSNSGVVSPLPPAPESEDDISAADIKAAIKALKPFAGTDPDIDESIAALENQLKELKKKKS